LKERLLNIFYLLPKGDGIKLTILFFMMLLAAMLEVIGVGMIPAFVAIVAAPEKVLEYEPARPFIELAGIESSGDLLLWGGGLLIGIFVVKSIYIISFNYLEARFLFNRRYTISLRMMNAYMRAPYLFHLQKNTAELIRNATVEVNILINSVLASILKLARDGVMAAAILLFLIIMEPLITLIIVVVMGAGAGTFVMLTQKKVKSYGIQEQEHRKNLLKTLQQGLGGIKEARVLNREKDLTDKFKLEAYKSTRLLAFIRYVMQIPKPVVETSAVIGMMMVAGFMLWQGRPMEAIIPILTLFAMGIVKLMPAVNQLSSMYTSLQYNIVSVDPIYEDLKSLEDAGADFLADRSKTSPMHFLKKIEVNDLHYSYPGSGEEAISGVSFKVFRGEAIALVGSSGAGKTTMVDLLLGLFKPDSGEIYVDGVNVWKNLSAWQKNIGYIPQSIYLADETLRENIAFGIPLAEIDDEKVRNAIELAQLSQLVRELPDGLDTIVGEHGTRLSGGQRQRIGIARALYHDPQVLVMDEATSALDNVTEQHIIRSIEALKGDRTVIMIAHRLTTVMNCDRLYLMEKGKIIHQGSYSNLLKHSQEFREMALES
jgi:ATP-binding cassette, subfamily B, bacterial PglK